MVLDIRHLDWGGRRERTTELTLHLIAEPVEPLLVEEILEARMAPVAAVAVIALHLDHGLGHLPPLAGSGEAQRVGEPDLMIRSRSRQQVIRHLPRNAQDFPAQSPSQRRRA